MSPLSPFAIGRVENDALASLGWKGGDFARKTLRAPLVAVERPLSGAVLDEALPAVEAE